VHSGSSDSAHIVGNPETGTGWPPKFRVTDTEVENVDEAAGGAQDGRQLLLPRERLLRRLLSAHAGQARHCPGDHATAHKIARILYHVLLTKEPYAETVFHRCDEQAHQRAEMHLRKQAAQLGFQLLPMPAIGE
jgi:hypothetical protein